MDNGQKEYNLKELEQLLGININTLKKDVKQNLLKGHKVSEANALVNPAGRGLELRFTREDVGHYLYNKTLRDRRIN